MQSDSMLKTVKTFVARLWETDAPLTGGGLLMLAALVFAVVGLALDPRIITGMPAWMKPAKFAISTAIFMLTLAWVFTYLPSWVRTRHIAGRITAGLLVMEVVIIFLQAWRGTTSHFNAGTAFDAVLFAAMGIGIGIQTLMSVVVAVALWRQPFADRALGWALRLGLVITITGASTGGLMIGPSKAQLAEARITHRLPIAGSHTVGAPDGGPGVPGTGWSREHGDLRVPHFLGLHAFQLLPIVAFAVTGLRLAEAKRVRLIFVIGASYFSLFAILLWQALRAQSLLRPDSATAIALASWAAATVMATWIATARRKTIHSHVAVS